jgi:putative addiction module component (TIGR02574 family)
MTLTISQIEAEARELTPEQRADLAQRLFASLEDDEPLESAEEVEGAWMAEAERRYQRYVAGETRSSPASEVFARIRRRLRDP